MSARTCGRCAKRSRWSSRTRTPRSIRASPSDRDRRGAADPQDARRPPQAGARAARARRAVAGSRSPVPTRVLGRSAPARRHRPRAQPRPEVHRARRAGVGPRRVDPGRRHQPAPGPPGRAQPLVPVHRPRPVGGPPHLRHGRRDVPRQADGGRPGRGAVHDGRPPVHAGAAVGDPRARPADRARRASRSCSSATSRARSTRRRAAGSGPGARRPSRAARPRSPS